MVNSYWYGWIVSLILVFLLYRIYNKNVILNYKLEKYEGFDKDKKKLKDDKNKKKLKDDKKIKLLYDKMNEISEKKLNMTLGEIVKSQL